MTCLQIQKGKTLDWSQPWELFYSKIEGFQYQPGFIYKLLVKEDIIDNPPADTSSIKYTLIKVLEKKQDKRYDIHDIWMLEKIDEKTIELNKGEKRPQIEINITKMQVFGTNGCNSISGSLKSLIGNQITFGLMRETRKSCPNMDIPNVFNVYLSKVVSFKKDHNYLILFDTNKNKLLSFKRTD